MTRRKHRSAQKHRNILRRIHNVTVNTEGMDELYAFILSMRFPDGVYRNHSFLCKDCGMPQIWEAWQQKRWFEQMHGNPDSTAVRCRACRLKEKERKAEARRASLEGLQRKQAERCTSRQNGKS